MVKESVITDNVDIVKSAWHCPSLSRVDIKRTLSGPSGTIDAIGGITPS